ncbi:MAG TPA: aminoacyl-tRNA hydrolase [Myxococcota bacterium]|nr:aminoacyl-tRNA hydrolase [Myxococcota bacterium]
MRLFVGLGNPGARYEETPHNAGFVAIDRFARKHRLPAFAPRFSGEFARGKVLGEDVAVLKPQTFMNLSGESVGEARRYLPIEVSDVLVVFDEMDIPAGKLRLRKFGGHGGHNGLRSIIDALGSSDFPRLRIGIGRPRDGREATGHLLSKVHPDERARLSATIDLAVEALEVSLREGFESAMNRYNGKDQLGAGEP